MKYGIRKRSFKRSFKARTTGKLKRRMKKLMNPFYGKRGMGFIFHPFKAMYGWVYRRVTIGIPQLFRMLFGKRKRR